MPPYQSVTRRAAKDVLRRLEHKHGDLNLTIWEFEVGPGNALLFPPGFLHHTEAVGEGCSVSASLQFRHPFGVQYVRDYADRLLFSRENSFCFAEVWSVFLTGYFRGFARLQKQIRRRALAMPKKDAGVATIISGEVGRMFSAMDSDASGLITAAEIMSHLQAESAAMVAMDPELVEFDTDLEAEDWMACHDLDSDGVVSYEEYTKTLGRIAGFYVQAQAEGACDEGCDTPIKRAGAKPEPVDETYPGAAFDRKQPHWNHGRKSRAEL